MLKLVLLQLQLLLLLLKLDLGRLLRDEVLLNTERKALVGHGYVGVGGELVLVGGLVLLLMRHQELLVVWCLLELVELRLWLLKPNVVNIRLITHVWNLRIRHIASLQTLNSSRNLSRNLL